MKTPTDYVGTIQQRAKRPQSLRFHFGKREYAGTTEPMRFDLAPNSLAWIQLWTIRRKQIQAQSAIIALNLLRDLTRLGISTLLWTD